MRIAGVDRAVANLIKWSAGDDWAPCRDEVFASHLDLVLERFGVGEDELIEELGDAFGMLYGVMLEDFFGTRFGDDESNVVDDFIKRRGWREKVTAKRYLEAIRDSVMSLYEVVDLHPGRSVTLRDLVRGGEPVTVEDELGSKSAARWDRIAARVVTVNDRICLTGAILLLSHDAANAWLAELEDIAKSVRKKLRKEAKKHGEDPEIPIEAVRALLLEEPGARMFTQVWLLEVLEQMRAPPPDVRNADGDAFLLSKVRFPIEGDEAEVAALIDDIEHFVRDAPDAQSWAWSEPGSPTRRAAANRSEGMTLQPMDESGHTAFGSIEIGNGAVVLSTNSRERAERGRDLLASRLGDRVGPPLTSHEDLEAALDEVPGPGTAGDDEVPPEVAGQIIRDYLDDHYRQTLDDRVPALGGRTPRQAVKSKKGRKQVIEWLKFLENSEHRRAGAQGQEPYDMTWMWRELELDGER